MKIYLKFVNNHEIFIFYRNVWKSFASLCEIPGGWVQCMFFQGFFVDDLWFPADSKVFLYFLFQYYDLAADVLAENAHLTYKFLTPVNTACSPWQSCTNHVIDKYGLTCNVIIIKSAEQSILCFFL